MNLLQEGDRRKPGIVRADTLDSIQALCPATAEVHPPRLAIEGLNGFNIVEYDGCYWRIPLSLGSVNLPYESDRQKPGIVWADTLDSIKILCG